MKTILTNSVKTAVKKTAKKSESVILKTSVNNNWKKATRSISGLVRYAKNEGRNDIEKLISATNKSKGTSIKFGQVANAKNILANATDREKFNKDGSKKLLFSFWLVILTVGRIAKAEKLATAKTV